MHNLIEAGKRSVKWIMSDYQNNITPNCLVEVERMISLPDFEKPYNYKTSDENEYDINGADLYNTLSATYGDFGDYWTIGWGNGQTYRDSSMGGSTEVLIRGYVPIEKIDWSNTIGVSIVSENETYFEGSPMFTEIVINGKTFPLNPPRIYG